MLRMDLDNSIWASMVYGPVEVAVQTPTYDVSTLPSVQFCQSGVCVARCSRRNDATTSAFKIANDDLCSIPNTLASCCHNPSTLTPFQCLDSRVLQLHAQLNMLSEPTMPMPVRSRMELRLRERFFACVVRHPLRTCIHEYEMSHTKTAVACLCTRVEGSKAVENYQHVSGSRKGGQSTKRSCDTFVMLGPAV